MPGKRPRKEIDPVTGFGARPGYGGSFRCACGKSGFVSRKVARAFLKARFPGERMQTYRCRQSTITAWHFGHPWGHERRTA